MNVFELVYAIHAWLRQLHIHCAYYRWHDDLKSRTDGSNKALCTLFESAEDPGCGNKQGSLPLVDYIARELLAHPGWRDKVSNKQARELVRNRARLAKESNLAAKIQALEMLIKESLVHSTECAEGKEAGDGEDAGEGSSKGRSRRRGRPLMFFCKRSWDMISQDEKAVAAVERLMLTVDNFQKK